MHSVMILYKLFYYWIGGTKNINKKREGNFAPPQKKQKHDQQQQQRSFIRVLKIKLKLYPSTN